MGGIGSGGANQWVKRNTIESCICLDIRYLKKHGLLNPNTKGTMRWSLCGRPTGCTHFQMLTDHLVLIFKYLPREGSESTTMVQDIYFDHTPCNYGGYRQWFKCPGCYRRVTVLCLNGPDFRCRHCYNLAYLSQHQSSRHRAIYQKHKLGERVFEHYEKGEGWGKPKGMHWSTFERLKARHDYYERCYFGGVADWLYALNNRNR